MSKDEIIILHGWGLKGGVYESLASLLREQGSSVYAPDLPGFGDEKLKSPFMNLSDYVDFLGDFIKKNKISRPVLIGHSFGGRIALKYSWRYPKNVSKLVLTGVPIIRNKPFLRKIWFIFAVIFGRLFKIFPKSLEKKVRKLFYFAIGEWDYYKSGPLKQVFKNIIGEDLDKYIEEIEIPVLLVWGKDDKITPVSDVSKVKKMNRSIKTVIVKGTGHKLPYEKPIDFYKSIVSFI